MTYSGTANASSPPQSTANTTQDINTNHFRFENGWMVAQVVNSTLTIGSVWAAASLIVYEVRTGKWKKGARMGDNSARLMLTLACASLVTMLARLALDQAVIVIGLLAPRDKRGDDLCEITMDISIIVYTVQVLLICTCAWFRQRYLYLQPSTRHLYTALVKTASWGCLLVIYATAHACLVLLILPLDNQISDVGCVLLPSYEGSDVPFTLTICTLGASQLVWLALFVYPLRRHHVSMRGAHASGTQAKTQQRVYHMMWRTTICMVVLFICAGGAIMLTLFLLPDTWPRCLAYALGDVGLFVSTLAVIYTFDAHRGIMVSICKQPAEEGVSSSARGESTTHNVTLSMTNVKNN